MRELDWPVEVTTDPKATEMVRVWIANKTLHVSMLLGMWADTAGWDVDERDAWGELLADLTRHIANGLGQSHGWDAAETIRRIADSYTQHVTKTDVTVEGSYPREESEAAEQRDAADEGRLDAYGSIFVGTVIIERW